MTALERKPHAYGYCRVSTGEQVRSCDIQSDLIRERAERLEDVVWGGNYAETTSARKVRYLDREVFPQIMRALRPGDYLLVWRLDRLERSMFGMAEVLKWCTDREVRLIILQHGGAELDLSTMSGKIIAWFLAGMAEVECEQQRQSTIDALAWRRANGYALGGQVPFGWKRVVLKPLHKDAKPLKMHVPDEREMQFIREIVARVDAGESRMSIGWDFYRRQVRRKGGKLLCKPMPSGRLNFRAIMVGYNKYKELGEPSIPANAVSCDEADRSSSVSCGEAT